MFLYLRAHYPNYVGNRDMSDDLKVELRTIQRSMKALQDGGYLEFLEGTPRSYRLKSKYME